MDDTKKKLYPAPHILIETDENGVDTVTRSIEMFPPVITKVSSYNLSGERIKELGLEGVEYVEGIVWSAGTFRRRF